MKYDRAIIVDNINILINDNDITQSDLAKIIGTHQSRLSECLNKKKDFTLPQLVAIADYFDISIDDLLGRPSHAADCPDTLSELCEFFFSLADNINCEVGYQYVDGLEVPFDLYEDYVNEGVIDTPINKCKKNESPDPILITPATNGARCIAFFNQPIAAFLDEWSNAKALLELTNGRELYETWKQGIFAKYKNNLKKYHYKTKYEYQKALYEESCRKYFKRSDLSDIDAELLDEFEKEYYDDLHTLPFIENDDDSCFSIPDGYELKGDKLVESNHKE